MVPTNEIWTRARELTLLDHCFYWLWKNRKTTYSFSVLILSDYIVLSSISVSEDDQQQSSPALRTIFFSIINRTKWTIFTRDSSEWKTTNRVILTKIKILCGAATCAIDQVALRSVTCEWMIEMWYCRLKIDITCKTIVQTIVCKNIP